MNLMHAIDPVYALLGFGVGVMIGMTGMGGGSLMTPLLILMFGIHPVTAVGTDLLYAAITKSGGTLVHGFYRTIEWRVVARLAAGSAPMALLTLLVLSRFNLKSAVTQDLINIVLASALFASAVVLMFREQFLEYAARVGELSPTRVAVFTVVMGGMLGVLVSVSSVGAGALGVTALILLYPRLPTVRIVGSDIAHAVPLTLLAGVGYSILGTVNWPLLGSLLVGSLPGICLGSYASRRMPETALRIILTGTLLVVASHLVL